MKKAILYLFAAVILFSAVFLYQIYYGQNRFALMLNQGADVPSGAKQISITKRRGVAAFFTNMEYTAVGSCIVAKPDFSNWFQSLDFEVIIVYDNSTKKELFYSAYSLLPKAVLENKIPYLIQLKKNSTDVRHIDVVAEDEENVKLVYEMDRN